MYAALDGSAMRSSLLYICSALVLTNLAACDDLPDAASSRVLEIHCGQNTGFDADKLCLRPDRPGAELEVRVNANTQKVQISILKNDGNWFLKNFILDNCSVVDAGNWKCTETTGKQDGPIYMVREYGMLHQRYYTSLTGGGGADYYTSSISGFGFWALHYGVITLPTALKSAGYSASDVGALAKN
jgi:hypothetical protein